MIITPRDINVLSTAALYCVLTAAQIRRLCFENDPDGRICRRRLQALVSAGLLHRTRMEVVAPLGGLNAPCYYSARKGLEFLAVHFEDAGYLALSSQKPQWQHLQHWVSISDLHILINQAAARETAFAIENWTNEYDVVNKDAAAPEDKYRLYTLLSPKGAKPRLVCAPDYMFVMRGTTGGARVVLGELERGTSHPEKAAAMKHPAYAEMANRKTVHKRFCPDASDKFMVLVTAPDAKWRDQLVKAFGTKPEPMVYRFAALPELTPETFFRGEVWHRWAAEKAGGEPQVVVGPIVKAQEGVPPPVPSGVRGVSEPGQDGRKGTADPTR